MFLAKCLTRACATATILLAARAQRPIIDLGYAEYQGTVNSATNIANFLGIRYAAAPLGRSSLFEDTLGLFANCDMARQASCVSAAPDRQSMSLAFSRLLPSPTNVCRRQMGYLIRIHCPAAPRNSSCLRIACSSSIPSSFFQLHMLMIRC
jgi:hypothetical protein